ncbi:MAG TPA: hypothetical protein VJQ47_04690 [Steroidobacteraceae bacterium]|nr:hypothetical protein [Steroidobacteraceae bacterium]
MKLYTSDDSELMDIRRIYAADGQLVVEGTIMGAMPVRAIIKPAEMRKALGLMSLGTRWSALRMLLRRS